MVARVDVLREGQGMDFLVRRDSIHLPASDREVNLSLVVPNHPRPDDITYAFRLQARSSEWKTAAGGMASVRNLPTGVNYLEFRAEMEGEIIGDTRWVKLAVDAHWWEQVWFWIAAVSVLIAVILLYYQLRIKRVRQAERLKAQYARELAEVQLLALRAQMNPHFLFNTINSINHFILRNDRAEASAYLTKFSRLMRRVLQNAQSKMLLLADEIEVLKLYVELEQLRFEHIFEFELKVGDNVQAEQVLIPPLIIQPYVENAIWHGLTRKKEGGLLSVSVARDNGVIGIAVKDNGIGRDAALRHGRGRSKSRIPLGANLTKARVDIINELYNLKADLRINDLFDAEGKAAGTEVVITLPVIPAES